MLWGILVVFCVSARWGRMARDARLPCEELLELGGEIATGWAHEKIRIDKFLLQLARAQPIFSTNINSNLEAPTRNLTVTCKVYLHR